MRQKERYKMTEETATITNWRKVFLRSLAAIPAALLAGGVVRILNSVADSLFDLYQPINDSALNFADNAVMTAVLVSILPRFKRTTSVLCGSAIVIGYSYLIYLTVAHNKTCFVWKYYLKYIPSLIFGVFCILRYSRASVFRNNEGIDEFTVQNDLFNFCKW